MESLPLPARIVHPLGYPRVANLPTEKQRSLRAFWLDGVFASISGAFVDSYYTLYFLALGASNSQIGLVNTLVQLANAGMSVPGAMIADRTGRYKRVTVVGGLLSRAMLPLMIVIPWLLAGPRAVWLVMLARVGVSVFGALGVPAWTALQADLVPTTLRASYFASRNIAMQIVQLAAVPLAGQVVNAVGEPVGYQVNLFLALVLGLVALHFYNQQEEHHEPSVRPEQVNPLLVLRRLRQMPLFKFTMAHTVMMFGVMVGGPFIQVYWVQVNYWDAGTVGLMTAASLFSGLLAMRLFARLQPRLGILRTMGLGLGLTLLPVLWLGVSEVWQGVVVQLLAGASWAVYNLGAFTLLLASTPDEHRPQYVAVHTTIISVVGAIGPVLGGSLLDLVGFMPVFALSTIIRAGGLALLIARMSEPAAPLPETSPG